MKQGLSLFGRNGLDILLFMSSLKALVIPRSGRTGHKNQGGPASVHAIPWEYPIFEHKLVSLVGSHVGITHRFKLLEELWLVY